MVFLIGAGGRGIGRTRRRQMLVFAHQGGAGDLGDHQPAVQARVGGQERRQVVGQRRVHHQRDAALRDGPDLADGKRSG